MAMIAQLEYRFNLFTDAVIQPVLTAGIEFAMWIGIFGAAGTPLLAGFPRSSYLSYALWTPFFARISANWMYEFRMAEEIETGTVNSVLTRPISFYEFYLGQFMGYKLLTTGISFVPPFVLMLFYDSSTRLERLPLSILLTLCYLVLVHTISFTVASFGFYFTNVGAFTVAKNIGLWMLTGELFPLDMMPEPIRSYILLSPFSCAVFRPVGYLIGRIDTRQMLQSFAILAVSMVFFALLARTVWLGGRRRYSGTGA